MPHECPICLDTVNDFHSTPCCGNQIHRTCLRECLDMYHRCPLCMECMHVIEIPRDSLDKCTKYSIIIGSIVFSGIITAFINVVYR